jgi:hypothetical protein
MDRDKLLWICSGNRIALWIGYVFGGLWAVEVAGVRIAEAGRGPLAA